MRFVLLLLPVLFLVTAMPAMAQKSGPEAFIGKMTSHAIDFLANPDLSFEQRKAKFRSLLRQDFDLRTIGRFVLGRYWNQATPSQQKEYMKLFEDRVVNIYSNRFKEYNGQKIEVRGSRPEGDDTLVTTFIVSDDSKPIQIDWRVRSKNGYKIVDVVVEGVSMSMTQRSDYASVIQTGGGDIEFLLASLREKQS
ncbi:MAG: ABC transporter substrate-binding protein [Alphaproteobacteria bacterium]|nr:ABC transporter substrate-binding protein [Alphaproteobacteria bacterium]